MATISAFAMQSFSLAGYEHTYDALATQALQPTAGILRLSVRRIFATMRP
jgi:hypothetical protein